MKIRLPKIYEIGLKFPLGVVFFLVFLVIGSLYTASFLKINSDPLSLLPAKTPSVKNLAELKKYFGSNNFLMISIEADNPALVNQFANDLIDKLKYVPEILYVDFKRPASYFKDRQWLFIRKNDLLEIEQRIDRTLELEKQGVSLVFNDYVDFADPEDRPDLTFKDILDSYINNPWVPKTSTISDEGGKFAVLRLKVSDDVMQYESSKSFLEKLRKVEKGLKENFSYKDIKVGYSGTLVSRMEQNDSIKNQIFFISVIVAFVLSLIIYLYFGKIESIFIIGIPLTVGIFITGGITCFIFDHLNLITSFGGGIIAGLGSDYGIYLLSRYYHERAHGKNFDVAVKLAFANTGSATFGSMITTAGVFLAFLFSDFRFFYEFGTVGALGIALNYVSMMLLMPSFLYFLNRFRKKKEDFSRFLSKSGEKKSDLKRTWKFLFYQAPLKGLAVFAFLVVLSFLVVPQQSQIHYQQNLTENKRLTSKQMLSRVGRAIKISLSPTVLIVRDEKEEQRVIMTLNQILHDEKREGLPYRDVAGISTFVSPDLDEKKEIIARIEKKMKKVKYLPQKQKDEYVESFIKSLTVEPPTRENLPLFLKRFFESPFSSGVSAVYLYPSIARSTNENLKKYHDSVLELIEENHFDVIPVDINFSADDMIQLITSEAPEGLLLAFVFLISVCLIQSRSLSRTVLIIFSLSGTLVILSGVMWMIGIKLNVINIVALLIILGTGIDSFFHFAQYYDEHKDMPRSFREKMPAVLISNITSIAGFVGLILTSLYGLQSLGWTVTLGLILITLVCLFVFPRGLILEEKLLKNKKKKTSF